MSIQLIVMKRYELARNNHMPSTGNLYKIKLLEVILLYNVKSNILELKTKILISLYRLSVHQK